MGFFTDFLGRFFKFGKKEVSQEKPKAPARQNYQSKELAAYLSTQRLIHAQNMPPMAWEQKAAQEVLALLPAQVGTLTWSHGSVTRSGGSEAWKIAEASYHLLPLNPCLGRAQAQAATPA